MMLDAFGIDFGGFPADADGEQEVDHDLVSRAGPGGDLISRPGQE